MRSATPSRRLAYAITAPGLAACTWIAMSSSLEPLTDPLTIALALCAVCASIAYVPLEGKLLVDATFVPLMLAIAFLGPAAAFAIVVSSELGAWAIQRYRLTVVPINLLAVGAVALGGATTFEALQLDPGGWFYLALAAIGALTLFVNDIVITSLVGILDGSPIRSRLRGHVRLVPALAMNVILAVAAANIYSHTGIEVVLFVCALVLAFNYMVRQTLSARDRAKEVERLAASRAELVSQTLDAEERERRSLAESLHDGVIQAMLSAGQDLRDAEKGDVDAVIQARHTIEQAVRDLRSAVFGLHPAALLRVGLAATLEEVVRHAGERGGFEPAVMVDPEAVGIEDRLVLSLARELVANAVKHSDAQSLALSLSRSPHELVLHVSDDGNGFDPVDRAASVLEGHIGLTSCMERVEARNGSLVVTSAPGQGTTVTAVIPIPEQHPVTRMSDFEGAPGPATSARRLAPTARR